jgi:hypothetical protein
MADYGFADVRRPGSTPTPRRPTEDRERETQKRPGESDKAYELRKALEATDGGDTRRDRTKL